MRALPPRLTVSILASAMVAFSLVASRGANAQLPNPDFAVAPNAGSVYALARVGDTLFVGGSFN